MRTTSIRHLLAATALTLVAAASAQADFPASYRFRNLTVEEGLSQGGVNATLQDADGFVWIATQDGINRYDGSEYRAFNNDLENPRSLSGNGVWCLALDKAGHVWYGTEDAGFGYYDPETDDFTNFRYDPKIPDTVEAYEVIELVVQPDQTIWLATGSHGILHFDPADSTLTRFDTAATDSVKVPTDDTWSVAIDREGLVWAGTAGGLVQFGLDNKPQHVFRHSDDDSTSLINDVVYDIYADSHNNIWVGTVGGLDLLDKATGTFRHFRSRRDDPTTVPGSSVSGIAEDEQGHIWVATMVGGLGHLDVPDGKGRRLTHDPLDKHSLLSNAVNDLYIDDNGLLWAATSKGVSILDLRAKGFVHLAPGDPATGHLADATVWAVAEDRNSDIWVGTANGLHRYEPRTNTMHVYRHDKADSTSACNSTFAFVRPDSAGNLWIGSNQGGLSRYDYDHDNFINYGYDGRGPESMRKLRCFGYSAAPDGTVWLATIAGLLQYDAPADSFIVHGADSTGVGLSTPYLRAVYADRNGKVWLGTWLETLECYDPRTGEALHFKHDPNNASSISNNVVICFHEDRRGNLWVGTGNGLNRYNRTQGTFEHFGTKDGLPNNTIYGILEAADGALWISTNAGVSRFDPIRRTFDNYDASDGLQDNEFNSQACALGASGTMYFGGINGLSYFKPEEIHNSTLQPRVAVTSLQLLNRDVAVGPDDEGRTILSRSIYRTDEITLKPSDRVVTLGFSAFDYVTPRGVRYSYTLEGFDKSWHQVDERRHATYTNLAPGNYTFRVRATNHDGVWSPHEASLAISVPPPFWRTIWFALSVVALVLGLLRTAYYYRTRLMRRRNRELEQKVAERTVDLEQEIVERQRAEEQLREATDKALAATRAKTEFLANMSHEMRTPLNGVIGISGALLDTDLDSEQLEYCEIVQSSANALLNVINDVLDFSKIEVGKLEIEAVGFRPRDVVDEIGDMLSWQAYEKGISYAGIVDADVPDAVSGDPGRVRQVLLNLVGNAVKFTAEGQVEVRVTRGETLPDGRRPLRWVISDTGVGIPAEKQGRLFQSFSQVDASTTRRYGGTGLGLAISKQLVELMGGTIGCESEEGAGARFWFELPLPTVAEKPVPGAGTGSAATVLVISCREAEREVLDKLLTFGGREVLTAHDTATAVQTIATCAATQRPLEAVVVGCLPGVEDPGDFLTAVGADTTGDHPPLVLVSSPGDRMDRRLLQEKGYFGSLTWPVNHRRLFRLLAEIAGVGEAEAERSDHSGAPVPPVAPDRVPHLLLAEDNPINQRVAGLVLTKMGYTFDVVASGTAAVEALSRAHYDAVLMDVQMPEMDGLEATRIVRDPASGVLNHAVPILAMTAHAMSSDRDRCLAAGMDEHLTKPIQSVTLGEALERHLGAGVLA